MIPLATGGFPRWLPRSPSSCSSRSWPACASSRTGPLSPEPPWPSWLPSPCFMPTSLAGASFLYGVATGLMNIVWIVIAAVYLYDISVSTGDFQIMKASVGGISSDRRLQLLLVAFCFGAFIEGCAGFGSPVAIAGAFMIGLGFKPFHAAALNLIANTAPVAWGSIGTPVHMLVAVTFLPEADMNAMIGRILPITAVIVPFWLVRA